MFLVINTLLFAIFNFVHLLSLKIINISFILILNFLPVYQIYNFQLILLFCVFLFYVLVPILFANINNKFKNFGKLFNWCSFSLIFLGIYKTSNNFIFNAVSNIKNSEIINFFFLALIIFSLFCLINCFSAKIEILEIIFGLFFISIGILFYKNANSLLVFYFVIEIFSAYFFVLIFNEKKQTFAAIKFYSIILNIISSILAISLLFVYYDHTGCLELHFDFLIEFKLINLFNILYFSFLFLKLGYFIILPIYINFYSYLSIKPIFFSIVILKTLIIWFHLNNFQFFNLSIKIWHDLNLNSRWFFLNAIIISILLGTYVAKQLAKSKPIGLLFLSSFISSQLILILLLSNVSFVNPAFFLNSVLFQYIIISTCILISVFYVKSNREFYFSLMLFVGFPGPLFFFKLGFFDVMLFNGVEIYILILSMSALFLIFIQEFLFSFKNNKTTYSLKFILNNKPIFLYNLICSFSIAFFIF